MCYRCKLALPRACWKAEWEQGRLEGSSKMASTHSSGLQGYFLQSCCPAGQSPLCSVLRVWYIPHSGLCSYLFWLQKDFRVLTCSLLSWLRIGRPALQLPHFGVTCRLGYRCGHLVSLKMTDFWRSWRDKVQPFTAGNKSLGIWNGPTGSIAFKKYCYQT